MKNLLFFASDFSIGVSSVLTDQIIAINQTGAKVIGVGGEKEQEPGLHQKINNSGISFITVNGLDEHNDFNRLVDEIKNIINSKLIDVIHVQNNWQLAITALAKFKSKRNPKIVYTIHGFRNSSPVKAKVAQIIIGGGLFLFSDKIICMTDYLKGKFSLLKYKIIKLPLGIKDSYFIPEFIPPKTDHLRIIFPAQFRPGKNQDLIIKAFADYIKNSKDKESILILPGNGPLLEEMKDLANNLGVNTQVEFPGFVSKEKIKQLYLDSNVAVVASNSETFGQSIVEPFVLGRCVVSTPVGITPEIIKEGINGFIFENEKDLKKIFFNLSSNPESLITIGNNNFDSKDSFSWKNISSEYIKLLLTD